MTVLAVTLLLKMLNYLFSSLFPFRLGCFTGKAGASEPALISFISRGLTIRFSPCFFLFAYLFLVFLVCFGNRPFRCVFEKQLPRPPLHAGASHPQTAGRVGATLSGGGVWVILGGGCSGAPTPSLFWASSTSRWCTSGEGERDRPNGRETFSRCRSPGECRVPRLPRSRRGCKSQRGSEVLAPSG